MFYTRRLMLTTAVVSAALIGYQVVMLQILAISQWHHFANMVVSIALLGFGAAGTTLSLWRERVLKKMEWLLPLLTALSGFSMVAAVELGQHNVARFDSYLLFVHTSQWVSLLITYVLYILPFYFGALVLGIIFIKYADEIGSYYFVNLIGSGVGGVATALFAWLFIPSVLPALFGVTTCFVGLLILPKEKRWFIISIITIVVLYDSYRMISPISITTSEYKSLARSMNLPGAKIVHEKPSPFGLIQVLAAEGLRYAPGMSLTFTGEIPVKSAAFNNGEWVGPLVSRHDYDTTPFLDFTTMGLPYALSAREKVLILHSGTGLSVAQSLSQQVKLIHAVEPNEALVNLLCHELAPENDSIFYHPNVKLFAIEPRSFFSATHEKYDLISLPIVGSFGGTMGMYSMREEYMLTIESFLSLYDLLEDDGVICVTAWMDYPFRNPLKVAATLWEVLAIEGKTKADHLVAVRSWGTVTYLLGKSPFSSREVTRLRSFCDSLWFDPLLIPGITDHEKNNYNVILDTAFFSYIDQIISGRKELFQSYDFYLNPATDDRPYFSQFVRWKSIPHLSEVFGAQAIPFLEMGFLVSVATFIQLGILSVILIVAPLTRMRWKSKFNFWTLLYFGGLGIGYMLFEIVMIQRFMLVFANAVYAIAFVVGVMLISSGFGSYCSSVFTQRSRAWLGILLMIGLILFLYSLFLSPVLQSVAGFSDPLKWILSAIIIAVPSFFMGIPFPTGIRFCASSDEATVPWAWAINGSTSVISAAIASLLAVEFGFTLVIITSSVAYFVALWSSYRTLKSR